MWLSFLQAWSTNAREWRHNRCIMTPLTSVGLLCMGLFWLLVLITKFPTLVLGLLLSPCMHRMQFVIEFLYPTALGRFVHLTICRMVMRSKSIMTTSPSPTGGGALLHHPDDKNFGSHSRTIETRIEVIPGRIYIHPLPQLLDNLGYLVVCCPPPETNNKNNNNNNNQQQQQQQLHNNSTETNNSGYCVDDDDEGFEQEEEEDRLRSSNISTIHTTLGKITIAPSQKKADQAPRIVAFIVDCGDAHAVHQQLQHIRARHYQDEMIYVQAILSTHKHHDHTAGNVPFLRLPEYGKYLKLIVGGAVERVPGCNFSVKNGQVIPLPKHATNVMNDLIQVEAVATPGHTRGSMTFIIRPINNNNIINNNHAPTTATATTTTTTTTTTNHNNNSNHDNNDTATTGLAYLFTGDTVFSGGGGVPFEADLDPGQEEQEAKKTFTSFIHASAAGHAVERCFAEILARIIVTTDHDHNVVPSLLSSSSVHNNNNTTTTTMTTTTPNGTTNNNIHISDFASLANRSFILPGHEYTQELLGRQLRPQQGAGPSGDACKWKNFPPSYFFETASHFYLAMHRRGLPQSNGKLVTAICAPVQRELLINPVFRTLKRRAEVLVPAIIAWNRRFARHKVTSQSIMAAAALDTSEATAASSFESTKNKQGQDDEEEEEEQGGLARQNAAAADMSRTSRSTEDHWNLNSADLSRSVFCTVYTSDMEMLVADLTLNKISTATAARRLKEMQQRLDEPLISRRPLPGTLPSDRAVYRGLLALAILGSSPTAMTLSDSRRMNLPKPIVRSSDTILVSRKRVIAVLSWLGLISNDIEGRKLVGMIHQLWKEACEDATAASVTITPKNANSAAAAAAAAAAWAAAVTANSAADPETGNSINMIPDLTELGNLKWTLYGVPRQQKSALFCLPCCGSSRPERMDPEHAVSASGLKPHSGELVRHDVMTCPLCIDLTGGGGASSCLHAPTLSVTTSSMHDNPATRNGGSTSRNKNYHNISNSMDMRDDSANNSFNNNDNMMIRDHRPAVLARHGTTFSEEGGGTGGIFGVEVSSLLREV